MAELKSRWRVLYSFTIMPVLYTIALWLISSAGASAFLQDIWAGMGVASAYMLYQIVRGHYSEDMQKAYEGLAFNDESTEA